MFVVLVPVNFASVFFMFESNGLLISFLAIAGILPNVFFLLWNRGFSNVMAVSHVIFWIPLLYIVAVNFGELGAGGFAVFCAVLFVIDLISLVFDIRDCSAWLKGDRAVVRP
jgi:hypothetical protein